MDVLELVNIQMVNNVGVDINMLTDHEHYCNQLQFVSGLGPRKAQTLIQRLKKRSGPIATRIDILSDKLMGEKVFMSAASFIKVRMPMEKRFNLNAAPNYLDQTRIQISDYELMERVAVFCSEYKNQDFENVNVDKRAEAVELLFKDSEKLRDDVTLNEIKEHLHNSALKGSDFEKMQQQNLIVDEMIKEFLNPFKDPREINARSINETQFSEIELLYCLIDETEQTFKKGMIVSATVVRVHSNNI